MSATIPSDIVDILTSFRLRKGSSMAAILFKIHLPTLSLQLDTTLDPLPSLNDLIDALPDTAPRFIVLSYVVTHPDGRISYPLLFLQYTPPVARPDQKMIYVGTRLNFGKLVGNMGKCLELTDSNLLSDNWIRTEIGIIS